MNIIMMGPQGSGKGTQASLLAERYGIPAISIGEIFREAIKSDSEEGREIQKIIDNGNMVPDELTIMFVKKRLEDVDCAEGFILDGFPRTLPQAKALDEFAKIDYVIVLRISDEEAVKRLVQRRQCPKCGKITSVKEGEKCKQCKIKLVKRKDDTEEAIKKRLEIYHDQTQPLIEYYKPRDIVHIINGEQSIEGIHKEILVALGDTFAAEEESAE
ncbi:adenylate kinase [Candidatus Woesearchaeota archaeon]|nr:adenylate kinase [Candidatus Woesearchaeota archaeon]